MMRDLNEASDGLRRKRPDLSAYRTFTSRQLVVVTGFAGMIGSGAMLSLDAVIMAMAIFFTFFYTIVILFRAGVLAGFGGGPSGRAVLSTGKLPGKLPDRTYTILVALYDEAEEIPALVAALDRLIWKPGRKRVHLICEAADQATIAAIHAAGLPAGFSLVIVPPGAPRTKPRALNYALARTKGDYLVIYDAEDRPDPRQLLEAHGKFQRHGPKLACLQAPLVIDNGNCNWLTRLFALEYHTLFRGILPSLESWHSPMPLGGTSNHFRGLR